MPKSVIATFFYLSKKSFFRGSSVASNIGKKILLGKKNMDINEIQKILPHRYPFLPVSYTHLTLPTSPKV